MFCAGGAYRLASVKRLETYLAFKQASRDDYYEYGRNLRELGVLGILDRPSAFRGIVYPAALSLLETYDPDASPRAPAAQGLVGSATILLAALLAGQLYGLGGGLFAAGLTAFHPVLRDSVPGSRVEILFAFLVLAAALALARWAREPSPRNSVLLGFALAVSILCRSVLFAFPLLLAATAFSLRIPGLRRKNVLLMLLASYAFLTPWIARNGVQFRDFIPFEQHAATRNFLAGALGYVENESGPFQDLLANEIDPKGTFTENPTGRMFALAVARISAEPLAYAASVARRLVFLLKLHPWLLLLALAALYRGRGDPAVRVLAVLCGYFILIHTPMSVEPRYVEPLLPALCVLAAGASGLRWPDERLFSPRLAVACVLAFLVPLYVLSVARLSREVALAVRPCSMPQGRLSAFYCGEAHAEAGRWSAAGEKYAEAARWLERGSQPMALFAAQLRVSAALAGSRTLPAARDAAVDEAARRHPEEAFMKAIWLQDRGRYADSLLLFDALVRGFPGGAGYLSNRAVVYLMTGRFEEARRDLKRSLRLRPANAHASLNYGMMLEKDEELRGALLVYLSALVAADKEALPAPERPFQPLAMISQRAEALLQVLRAAPPARTASR